MPNLAPKIEKKYTYADYLSWHDGQRWELIEGIPYNMSPAPSRVHQKILGKLFNEFYNYLKGKSCEVYAAPFDVRFPLEGQKEAQIETVVQPDIVVICDKEKLDAKGCLGSPDLIIEIISPSTAQMDMKIKWSLYERGQVTEYWIVYPDYKTVMIYRLGPDGGYKTHEIYTDKEHVQVGIFPDLQINLAEIFDF